MKKIVYDVNTGEILATYGPRVSAPPTGINEAIMLVKSAEIGRHFVDLETGSVIRRMTGEMPATWGQIKAKRDALEVAPITLDNGLTYDYDQQAKLRFETALSQFDNLPTLVDGKLTWKLSDNSFHPHTKAELQAAYDELQAKTAIRAAQLFLQAEILAAGNHTVADIEDLTNWGL